MATLLIVGNSEGSRRCDAKCYEAHSEKCDCICGGENHGAGLQAAVENVRKKFGPLADLMIEQGGVMMTEGIEAA